MPRPQPPYAPHETFVNPARPSNQFWRFILGLITLLAVAFGTINIINAGIQAALDPLSYAAFYDASFDGSTPVAMLYVLGMFGTLTIGTFFTVRFLHKRPALSLIGPLPTALGLFAKITGLLLILLFVLWLLPPWSMGAPLIPNLALNTWLLLLPLSLIAVLIQTSAEEILFRGYIQQQLAARFKSPLVWMLLPAALFALGHYVPEENGANAWIIALWAGIFGIFMADLTARAGNLGPAIAVHFVNNVSALLLVSLPESLYGLSLFLVPYTMQDVEIVRQWLPVDFAFMLCSWLVARLAIRR